MWWGLCWTIRLAPCLYAQMVPGGLTLWCRAALPDEWVDCPHCHDGENQCPVYHGLVTWWKGPGPASAFMAVDVPPPPPSMWDKPAERSRAHVKDDVTSCLGWCCKGSGSGVSSLFGSFSVCGYLAWCQASVNGFCTCRLWKPVRCCCGWLPCHGARDNYTNHLETILCVTDVHVIGQIIPREFLWTWRSQKVPYGGVRITQKNSCQKALCSRSMIKMCM